MSDFDDLRDAVTRDGDDTAPDRALLLWFVRHVMQVSDFDEYEVAFESATRPLDGLLVENPPEQKLPVLYLFECKMRASGPLEFGADGITEVAMQLRAVEEAGLADVADREIRAVALGRGLASLPWHERFDVRKVFVVAAELSPAATAKAALHDLVCYDLPWLARLARALRGPGLLDDCVHVQCPESRRFRSRTGLGNIVVCEVRASELAEWPGIEERTLFGLNVRGELRQNRVRTGLDTAIRTQEDHPNFIAYHNGLTVLCHKLDTTSPDEIVVEGLSVVNGAQSLLAFHRNRSRLEGSDLSVLVKFVTYTDDQADFATEVARRSNTQTAVNPRNLRANDPRQRALQDEFKSAFPKYAYLTKPEATRQPPGQAVTNDDAAQWLCSLYQQRPWLAVKRTELFRDPEYRRIFNDQIAAEHIVFARRLQQAVEHQKSKFPMAYRGAWRLTTLMALYLAGQAMRAGDGLRDRLEHPAEDSAFLAWLQEPDPLWDSAPGHEILGVVDSVAAAMTDYHEQRLMEFGHDDFKVDFKRENTALNLAHRATAKRRTPAS